MDVMKTKKIISDWFKPHFEKHPLMESFYFLIYNFDDGIYLSDEDCGINDLRWDELDDTELLDSSYKIQEAIETIKESKVENLEKIIDELSNICKKLQQQSSDSNPLNKVYDDVWCGFNRKDLTEKVKIHLTREIPWKYVEWCECIVKRNGEVIIEEHD